MKNAQLIILLIYLSLFDIKPSLSLTTFLPITTSKEISTISPPANSPETDNNLTFAEGSIKVIDGQICLNEVLQNELDRQIEEAKQELNRLRETLALDFTEELGFAYFHQGQNRWRLRFTYGGLLLKTSAKISLPTEQIFRLKEVFDHTEWIEVKGIKYKTTGSMRQLGPILHEE
ncbi:hypothetical protein [Gloeothece verrucosa]|uniref:Uncharacterized protein n=1 Tax=Gloeothece verrucosa (strain PCC 7822) TaxID=497965 RepID=E0U738_GLOV7|nr:hypothetical protein [Gloeothece verrucosa]ADN17194.1 hypothetical protein Cyan7822_5313 [Gloeothece verrucosa PCC 7822]